MATVPFLEASPPAGPNRSFRYGDGLFETMRVFEGRLLQADAHLDRLERGMQVLGFRVEKGWKAEWKSGLLGWVQDQGFEGPARVRLHVWRAGGGAYQPETDEINAFLESAPLATEYFEDPEPVSLCDAAGLFVHHSPLSGIKTASALVYVLAARQARERGFGEALLLSAQGDVAEASASNVFGVEGQTLFTSPLKSGCLRGVMRGAVLALAAELGLRVKEALFSPERLLECDAVFLTNAIRGIQPVVNYREKSWLSGENEVVGGLIKRWSEKIRAGGDQEAG